MFWIGGRLSRLAFAVVVLLTPDALADDRGSSGEARAADNRFAAGAGLSYLLAAPPPGGGLDFTSRNDAVFFAEASYFFGRWSFDLELGLSANQLSYEYTYENRGAVVGERRRYQNYFLNPVVVHYPRGRGSSVSPYVGFVLGLQMMVESGLNEAVLGQKEKTTFALTPGPVLGAMFLSGSRVRLVADVRWLYSFPKYERETLETIGPAGNVTNDTDEHFAPFVFSLAVQVSL